ncbi:MAG: RidA family protein [Paracoccaceae bacterium]|nr:RidA family protein [Paracoccaceae bacterium]
MNWTVDSADAPAPFSAYAQAIEVPAGARTIHVSGQVGVSSDGSLAEGVEAQVELAWQNIFTILAAARMDKSDIVDVLVLLKRAEDVGVYRRVRDRYFEGHLAASTMLVCDLAQPDWLVEIAVRAAKVD